MEGPPISNYAAAFVNKSATKAKLLGALHLNTGRKRDEEVYIAIKRDCLDVYEDLINNRQNIKPEYGHVRERFTYNQMKPEAINEAITRIYHQASPATREWYHCWQVDESKENHIIHWFLYHSFRNRDVRNDRRPSNISFHDDDEEYDEGSATCGTSRFSVSDSEAMMGQRGEESFHSTVLSPKSQNRFWDPARDKYRAT